MGQEEFQPDDRKKLLTAARVLLARGDDRFSITTLCSDAGVERAVFRDHFTGKAALMTALAQTEPESKAETPHEPVVSTPDAWLERRLRVFERALNALEEKAEATAREQSRAITRLEERLQGLGQGAQTLTPVFVPAAAPMAARVEAVAQSPAPEPEPEVQAAPQEDRPANPLLISLEPEPPAMLSKEEMADVLQSARGKVRIVPEPEPPKSDARLRWLAAGAMSLVVLFLCIGLSLGDPARARQASDLGGTGTAYRQVARDSIQRTIAMADSGDARAQARLALAYLRGSGVPNDAAAAVRWSSHAALRGQPVAQYLLGALYSQGEGVNADPARAFGYFAEAAARGNVKAMHNLAIAYAHGDGTAKDESKAAEWFERAAARGYVDSAFDLAVLYERGLGVPQDLKQALKWYGVAGLAGDEPSQLRADFLRQQLKPSEARLAANAAISFALLPAPAEANALPEF